jgi:hypothetical protein
MERDALDCPLSTVCCLLSTVCCLLSAVIITPDDNYITDQAFNLIYG